MTDNELCQAIAVGDRWALEMLYRRHVSSIIKYLRLLGCPPDWVEDGTHEVFLKVWTALERGQQPESFRVWLRRVAHNVLVDYWRRPQLNREVLNVPLPEESLVPDLDSTLDVMRALRQIDLPLREVLVLHFYQDLTVVDIAAVVGVPVGTVKSRLARAYRHLAALVRDRPHQDDLLETRVRRGGGAK